MRQVLSRAFAERLRAASALEDAGRVLFRCGDRLDAARCFLGAANWRLWAAAGGEAPKGAETGASEERRKEAVTLAGDLLAAACDYCQIHK